MKKVKEKGFPPATVPPGVLPQPPATKAEIQKIPQDWEPIWDEDFEEAYEALLPRHRLFVVELVRTGFKKAEAFRRAYPGATFSSAIVGAILSKPDVQFILERFTDWAKQNMFEAQQVIMDAMQATKRVYYEGEIVDEVDDHAIRLKAVEVLNKIEEVKKEASPAKPAGTIPHTFAVNFNFYLEKMGMPPIQIPYQQIENATKKA
jgi:hypothetical protein